MKTRKALPRKLEKEIYQQFGSKCPFCGEQDVTTLQVHHIVSHAKVQRHDAKNLLLTCANCHQKIENGAIPSDDVHAAKLQVEKGETLPKQSKPESGSNVISFSGSNTGIVANTINISNKSAAPRQGPISGTVGSDLVLRNYAKYLIDRYHEFKKAEVGKGAMKYALLYDGVKRKFGAKWDHLPVEAFDGLVDYLQKRIDDTRLGKARKAQGSRNYSSFVEHRAKVK
ncbi:HNH endonuclease signature motif containing protein [Roseibium album]|uniref:HNH endonuclease signature motif containing protein n=1 Tax=Roseibium album TaxID=311410 RepID=UPI0032993F96